MRENQLSPSCLIQRKIVRFDYKNVNFNIRVFDFFLMSNM